MSEKMFYVTLMNEGASEPVLQTHTFAYTHGHAVERMEESMHANPEAWTGWTFTVHPEGRTYA